MNEQTLIFDKETAALLVRDAADLVIKQFVVDHQIRLDDAQMEILAQAAAKHIEVDIDYPAIAEKLLPPFKNENRRLTKKIRADIAEEAVDQLLNSKVILELIVNAVIASDRIVSRDGFVTKLKELRQMIKLSKKQKNGGINAGISGQDMIDEITKALGQTTWQTGGVTDLTLPPIIKTIDATLALNETQEVIEYQNAGNDRVFTIPLNTSVSIPVGSWFEIWRTGSGEITIEQESSGTQTFRSVLGDVDFKIDGQDGFSVIGLKTAADTWLFKGNIKAV